MPVALLGFPETAAIGPFVGLFIQCCWAWWSWRLRRTEGVWPIWIAVISFMGIYARLAVLEIMK